MSDYVQPIELNYAPVAQPDNRLTRWYRWLGFLVFILETMIFVVTLNHWMQLKNFSVLPTHGLPPVEIILWRQYRVRLITETLFAAIGLTAVFGAKRYLSGHPSLHWFRAFLALGVPLLVLYIAFTVVNYLRPSILSFWNRPWTGSYYGPLTIPNSVFFSTLFADAAYFLIAIIPVFLLYRRIRKRWHPIAPLVGNLPAAN